MKIMYRIYFVVSSMSPYPINGMTINVVFKSFALVQSLAARGGYFKCEVIWQWLLNTYSAPGLLLLKGDLREGCTCIRNDIQTDFFSQSSEPLTPYTRTNFTDITHCWLWSGCRNLQSELLVYFLALLCLHEATSWHLVAIWHLEAHSSRQKSSDHNTVPHWGTVVQVFAYRWRWIPFRI